METSDNYLGLASVSHSILPCQVCHEVELRFSHLHLIREPQGNRTNTFLVNSGVKNPCIKYSDQSAYGEPPTCQL